MPSSPLENPFNKKNRNSDDSAFFKTVLGKKGAIRKHKLSPTEDFGIEDQLIISPEEQKRIEDERVFGEIILREFRALRQFFGKEILVPPLPKEATKERILEWRRLGLELHYLPPEELAEIHRDEKGIIFYVRPKNINGWKKKPDAVFFDNIKNGELPPEAATLSGSWMLIDSRPKPVRHDGIQKYPADFLAPILEELDKKRIIKHVLRDGKSRLAADSRFGISADELDQTQVMKAI
ncbi:MAG TPA: hypothetical protein VFQ60_04255, partial [Patescibacteria group bacterium]|nr:hypothetical protein [Patescibacteria group bacterium]